MSCNLAENHWWDLHGVQHSIQHEYTIENSRTAFNLTILIFLKIINFNSMEVEQEKREKKITRFIVVRF